MSVRYGRKGCRHVWRERIQGYEEYCWPLVCIKCGAFACGCIFNSRKKMPTWKSLRKGGCKGDADVNGKWVNPYVRVQISEEEFKRLQLLFDTKGIMYTSEVLHTKGFPSWVIFDEDMQSLLSSTKEDDELVFYISRNGKRHLQAMKETFVDIDGHEWYY